MSKADDQLISDSAAQAKITALGPTKDELIREFGRESYTEDAAKGEWRVAFRRPDLSVQENSVRARKFLAMYKPRGEAETAAGIERCSRMDTIPVRMRDGEVQQVPTYLEDQIAAEGQGQAVIRHGRATWRWQNGQWYERIGNNWYCSDNGPEAA